METSIKLTWPAAAVFLVLCCCSGKGGKECAYNSDCANPAAVCVGGRCMLECRTERDCAEGEDCVNSRCAKLWVYCETDEDCADGRRCMTGVCAVVTVESDPAAQKKSYGEACSSAADCASGLCLGNPAEGIGACTRRCGPEEPCPQPDECITLAAGTDVCAKQGAGQPAAETGTPCPQGPQICASGLCVTPPQGSPVCTKLCAGDADCPSGYECGPVQTADGEKQVCVPAAAEGAGFGEPCSETVLCRSGLCLTSGQCSYCTIACGGSADCVAGYTCEEVQGSEGPLKVCLSGSCGSSEGKQYGESCRLASDCRSELCLGDPSTGFGFCTQGCASEANCPAPHVCADAGGAGVCSPGQGETGWPCPRGGDQCASGLCLDTTTRGWVCTEDCASSGACPPGFACAPFDDPSLGLVFICVPAGRGIVGDPCPNGSDDCLSAICVGTSPSDPQAYCSRLCSANAPCPSGYVCSRMQTGERLCVK